MHYQDFLDMAALQRYAAAMNNRAAQYQASGSINADILRSVILESGGQCGWCSKTLFESEFEIDHILSLSHQGQNTHNNLVVACPECNRSKGEKHPVRFALELVALSGSKSPLIIQLLAQHNIESYVQGKLFDDSDNQKSAGYRKISVDVDDIQQIPPYKW